jgi:rare lipoprotein A
MTSYSGSGNWGSNPCPGISAHNAGFDHHDSEWVTGQVPYQSHIYSCWFVFWGNQHQEIDAFLRVLIELEVEQRNRLEPVLLDHLPGDELQRIVDQQSIYSMRREMLIRSKLRKRAAHRRRRLRNQRIILVAALVALIAALTWNTNARAAVASCYGPGLYGGSTANGTKLTSTTRGVAHKTLPLNTRIHIRYAGTTVTVRVIDRGPYIPGRALDITNATVRDLGIPDCKQWGHRNVRSWRAR